MGRCVLTRCGQCKCRNVCFCLSVWADGTVGQGVLQVIHAVLQAAECLVEAVAPGLVCRGGQRGRLNRHWQICASGCRCVWLQQVAAVVIQHLPVQCDAVRMQPVRQAGVLGTQPLPGLLVGVLGQFAALAVAEGVGQKQLGIAVVGLDEHDGGVGVAALVLFHAQLQPGVDHAAESLAHHRRESAFHHRRNGLALRTAAQAAGIGLAGIKGDQRIEAEHHIHAFFERHAGVHGFFEGTVHIELAVNFNGREQTGQSGAGRNGTGDGHMVPAFAPEGGRITAVKVGGHQGEPVPELAEIVGASRLGEKSGQLSVDFFVAEQAGGQGRSHFFEGADEGFAPQGPGPQGLQPQAGHLEQPLGDFGIGRPHQPSRVESLPGVGLTGDEQLAQLARGHAVGQGCRDEATRRHTHIVVAVVEVQALQRLVQGAQGPDLVDGSQRATPGQGQRHPGRRACCFRQGHWRGGSGEGVAWAGAGGGHVRASVGFCVVLSCCDAACAQT